MPVRALRRTVGLLPKQVRAIELNGSLQLGSVPELAFVCAAMASFDDSQVCGNDHDTLTLPEGCTSTSSAAPALPVASVLARASTPAAWFPTGNSTLNSSDRMKTGCSTRSVPCVAADCELPVDGSQACAA